MLVGMTTPPDAPSDAAATRHQPRTMTGKDGSSEGEDLPDLLCARRERPRCRAAEHCDELAPFHCPVPPVLPNKRNSTRGTAALRDFNPGYHRQGVNAAARRIS